MTKIKDKDKILKATRENRQITYKGTPIRLSFDFSIEVLQARKEWQDIFKVMKGKNLQTKNTLPSKAYIKMQQRTQKFIDKKKLREFSNTRLCLQQMLKEIL